MSEDATLPEDIDSMNFEQALAELERIVGQLESGDVSLEDSIDIYTRGTMLKRHCESKLRAAQEKVEKIVIGSSGEASGTEPAEFG